MAEINKALIGKEYPPLYLDDRVGAASEWGDVIAPPTFAVTFRDDTADTGALLRDLGTDISRILHGEQEFELFRPLQPGETCLCRARIVDIYQLGGGREGGRAPFCKQMKYGKVYFDDVKVGDELPPLVKDPIQQIQLTRYAGASGDFNPIHLDDEFARAAGMSGVFAHGMLSMGFVAQALTDWAGAGTVRKLAVRFAALVRLKDVETCRGRVLAKSSKDDVNLVELEVWAETQKAEKVVSGRATVALPTRA